jgi:hypothetical protein
MRRLLDVDPLTGTHHYVDYDETEDVFRFQQEVEAEPVTEHNGALYNDAPSRWGDMQKVASIPMPLWWLLKTTGILDDRKALEKWLNDPEHRKFRTRPGRV